MKFEEICQLKQAELKEKLISELSVLGYVPQSTDGFLYAEGDIPIMLVAHMDTVHKELPSIICKDTTLGVLMSPQGIGGDDRCGIYIILELLKTHHCHVLFTEDEETGCVGANKFCKSDIMPDINFIIEFDRKGHKDCVFYDCDNPDFTKFIESFGFQTELGSCSDISFIAPHLGVAAVNLSCGYFNPHTLHEFVCLSIMEEVIETARIVLDNCGTKFEYIEAAKLPIEKYYGGCCDYAGYYFDNIDMNSEIIDEMFLYDTDLIQEYTCSEALMILNDDEFIVSLNDGVMRDDYLAAIDRMGIVYLYKIEHNVWVMTDNYIAKGLEGRTVVWNEERATMEDVFDYVTYGEDMGYFEFYEQESLINDTNETENDSRIV